MKNIFKRLFLLMLVLPIFTAFVQAEDHKTYGLEQDTITVAISGNYQPFAYIEEDQPDEVVGFSMDIWKEFEKRTGIEVKFENTDFSGLLGLLESGRAEVVDAQLSYTEERAKKFSFTEPINYYGAVVVVAEDNEDIKSVHDLAGKKIGIGSGDNTYEIVEEMYEPGDIQWEFYTSATLDNMLKDVEMGRLDGMIAQNIQASMTIKGNNIKAKMTEPFDLQSATYVLQKDNDKLRNALNEFIEDLRADGTLKELSDKWIGTDITEAP